MKRALALLLAALLLCLCAPALAKSTPTPAPTATPRPLTDAENYQRAQAALQDKDWVAAANAFAELGDYEDAHAYFNYAKGMLLWSRQNPTDALKLLDEAAGVEDAAAQAARIRSLSLHRWWDGGLFGYVNLAGEVVAEAKWSYAPPVFAEDTARLDENGDAPAEALYYAPVYMGGLVTGETDAQPDDEGGAWGILASDGSEALACEYLSIAWVRDGYAAVQDSRGWLLYDLAAGAMIGERYEAIGEPGEAASPDGLIVAAQKGGLWGYVALPGGESIGAGFAYERCEPFQEGFGTVHLNGLAWFIDLTGKKLVTAEYIDAHPFSEGLAAVKSSRKRWGLIDTSGAEVLEFKYQDIGQFVGGVAPFLRNDKWGVMDATGAVLLKNRYDEIAHIDATLNRLWMRNNKLWGIASLDGEIILKPTYSTTTGFSADRMAGVSYRGAYGYIDMRGTVFIPLDYTAGTSFAAGLGAVSDGGEDILYYGKFKLMLSLYGDVPVAPVRGFIESRVLQSRMSEGEDGVTVESWFEYRLYNLDGEEIK